MKLSLFSLGSALLAGSRALVAADLDSNSYIEVVGNKFFYHNNGSQFYVKGIAYQSNSLVNQTDASTFNDPLADAASCKRDLPYLTQLNTNVLRVYAINTTLDHSECMNMFADAGIYVISDMSEPGLSINRADPSWDVELYARYTGVIDALGNYTNLLGFFAGNEVTNAANNTDADAYVKAAVRDSKAYIKNKFKRPIPVGYSASDAAEIRTPEAAYFACGSDDDHADFYGINMYEWCDSDATFQSSGYEARTKEFSNLSIPLFFSEYGCNANPPRQFTEVKALYGSDMNDVWSGGIVYMYFQEENNYGLVSVSGSSVSTLTDFSYLSQELATISPTIRQSSEITTTGSTIQCPSTGVSSWAANTNLPPTPNQALCNCVDSTSGCVVADDVDEKDYGDIFGYVCDQISCDGIGGNASTGVYGAFNGCNPKEKLNFVLNLYYADQNSASSACDFSGKASVNSSPKTEGSCSSLLKAAGTAGTNVVSGSAGAGVTGQQGGAEATATGTGSGSGSGGSGSGSGANASGGSGSSAAASSSKSKNAAAPAPTAGNMNVAAGALAAAVVLFAGAV